MEKIIRHDLETPSFHELARCKTYHRLFGHWNTEWTGWFPVFTCGKCGLSFHTDSDRSFFFRSTLSEDLSEVDAFNNELSIAAEKHNSEKQRISVAT